MSGRGAAGFSGERCFAGGASVNNMELSCSCRRAVCCFNSSVVGSADGVVGMAFGGAGAWGLVSIFAEVLAVGGIGTPRASGT